MPARRTIAIVTGTRAEYGLLEPVMAAVAARRDLTLRAIVAGSHLVTGTVRDVRYPIAGRVAMQKRGVSGRAADAAAMGRGVIGFGRVFAEMKPDFVVVLGDRIEAFAAASAASVGGFRVAHIHGGDRAEGVADEAMRHAISKLAHVHFAATVMSRKRLMRMGETHVYRTGSPAVDGLREVVAAADGPQVIVMQHPIGGSDADEARWMRGTLAGVKAAGIAGVLSRERLVMGPNGDPGCGGIRRVLPGDAVDHLARERWLSVLAGAKVIVGNSSAGLIEAAVLKTACVNVGPRQNGREKPGNVIDCDYGEANVRRAIERAMTLDLRRMRHPYGDGHAGQRMAELLATIDLDAVSVRKRNGY